MYNFFSLKFILDGKVTGREWLIDGNKRVFETSKVQDNKNITDNYKREILTEHVCF